MTGFGSAARERGGVAVRVEIRSVNHRHLQSKLRLPSELAHLESQLEAVLRKRLHRGSVSATVRVEREGVAAAARIDRGLLAAYREETQDLAGELGLDPPSLAELLGLPGVIEPPAIEAEGADFGRILLQSVEAATRELVKMREDEGGALAADLDRSATAIEKVVARIARRAPTIVRSHQKNLARRVSELAGQAAVSSTDLAREIALLADRLDVSEELTRLESHLSQLRKLLAKGGAVGRKLDFLAQEFLREANTIGSKGSDARLAHDVVELKTQIERLREQVQNVE